MNELDLFAAALAITDQAERAAWLDRECAAQPALRDRLKQLLDAHAQSSLLLDRPVSGKEANAAVGAGEPEPASTYLYTFEAAGTIIAGKYKLLQQIGEGGMGTVWMADQTEPVKRRVAVKLIRVERGNSKTILSRFEAERQAIALMDHPHIAKLLDAGTTDAGQPYFIMELVKGVPLTEYCDTHKLSIQQRLGLFQQICSAVQHAHQKGIIHRDLKPTNILVESHDDQPVPKVIDFGLAKATTGLQLTERTLFTAFGSVMGTPLYMAPEQAKFNAVDIDTRADIYSLGIILYELLTGTTPLTRDSLKQAALDEMLKLVREQEAPTPSSQLRSSDSLPSVAANRQSEPAKLGRFVQGELDWIVLKSLSKERDRRYDTANGFAKDIERFLNHEPVQAGPVTATYRIKKFVRRNCGQVLAASVVLMALLAGVAGTTWGLFEARKQTVFALEAQQQETRQRKLAETERDEKEKARQIAVSEKDRADRERAIAEAVKDFVTKDIFGRAGDLTLGQAADIKASVLLENAAAALGEKFKDQPEVEMAVRWALANGFIAVGLGTDACKQAEIMLAYYRMHRPKDHLDTLSTLHFLGSVNGHVVSHDEKLARMREAYEGFRRTTGEDHEGTLWTAASLAHLLINQHRAHAEALAICDRSLQAGRAAHPMTFPPLLLLEAQRASALAHLGRYDEAEQYCMDKYHNYLKQFGSEDIRTVRALSGLVQLMVEHGRSERALPLAEQCVQLSIRVYGAEHAETTYVRSALANTYRRLGNQLGAGQQYLDIAHGERLIVGPRSAWARTCQWRGVEHLNAVGQLDLAIGRAEVWAGSDHPDYLANAASLYGMIAQQTKDEALAEKSLRRGMELMLRAVARGWSDATRAADEFEGYRNRKDFQNLLAEMVRPIPSVYPKVLASLGQAHRRHKDQTKAVASYLDCIRLQEIEVAKQPQNEALREDLANFFDNLGDIYLESKNFENAMTSHQSAFSLRDRLFTECVTEKKRVFGDQAAWSIHNIGQVLSNSAKPEIAAAKFREAATYRLLIVPGPQTDNLYSLNLRRDCDHEGRSWMAASKFHEAEAAYRRAYDVIHEIVNADFQNSVNRGHLDWSQQRLAEVLIKLNRPDEAAELMADNVDLYRKTNPQGLSAALMRYGFALLQSKNWNAAEPLLIECLTICEKTQPDVWSTFYTQSMLGGALSGQKKYADAEPLLLKGYEGMKDRQKTIPKGHKDRLFEAIERLIELYEATEKKDEAAKWRTILDAERQGTSPSD